MRTAFDLRFADDRLAVGRALRQPLVEALQPDGQRRVPVGAAWQALREVAWNLREKALDRLREGEGSDGRVARLLAALGLGRAAKASPSAEELARFQGYAQALLDLQDDVVRFVVDAVDHDEQASKASTARQLREARGGAAAGPRVMPGRSGM